MAEGELPVSEGNEGLLSAPEPTVNLINPSGQLVSVPSTQAQQALNSGFVQPTPEQIKEATEEQQYGEGQALKAGALGAAGTFSLGVIPTALAESGIVPSEEQAALAKYNPVARGVGQAVGVGAGVLAAALTGGASAEAELALGGAQAAKTGLGLAEVLNPIGGVAKIGAQVAAPIEKKLLGDAATSSFARAVLAKTAAGAAGGAAEGAIFGVGNALDENALGDPDALGEHLLPSIGYGALFGGGVGGAIGGMKGGWGALKAKPSDAAQAAAYREGIKEGANRAAGGIPSPEAIQEAAANGEILQGAPPTSLDEIQARIRNAGYMGEVPGELPAKQVLIDSAKLVPDMEFPVNNVQIESLSDPRARDYYKALLESQTDDALALKNYEALQKKELTNKLQSDIRKLAPEAEVTADPTKGGESLVKAFTDGYQEEKAALAPAFEKFDAVGVQPLKNFKANPAAIESMLPGASKYLSLDAEGNLKLAPYKSSMPFSNNTYGAIKDLVEATNDKELTLGGLRNVREAMRDRVNFLSSPRDAGQISNIRKGLMDYIQQAVQEVEPDLAVRDTFKRYAINEEKRGILERIFGGSISDSATFAKTIKSEEVLDKLFANSVSVQAAKDILPAKTFNKAVGDYLAFKSAQVTDMAKNGFSSNKFATFLRTKAPELQAAFGDNPEALRRLQALTDIMRILPDSPSINPSGTAKTLNMLQVIHKIGSILNPGTAAREALGEGLKGFASKQEAKRVAEVMNQVLAGKKFAEAELAAQERLTASSVMAKIEAASKKAAFSIKAGARSIFEKSEKGAVPAAVLLTPKIKKEKHNELKQTLHAMSQDPQGFIDRISRKTENLYAFAPRTTAALQSTTIRASQFLTSKLPPELPPMPLSEPLPPSTASIMKFNAYRHAIENPTDILKDIKLGTVTPEGIEAVKTVYPKMFAQMQAAVMDQMADAVMKKRVIPYQTKVALAMFMGAPMDHTMTPAAIQATQPMAQGPQSNESQAAPPKSRGSMASIGKVNKLFNTPDQTRQIARANSRA